MTGAVLVMPSAFLRNGSTPERWQPTWIPPDWALCRIASALVLRCLGDDVAGRAMVCYGLPPDRPATHCKHHIDVLILTDDGTVRSLHN